MSSGGFSADIFRRVCGVFPTGVAVLTTRAEDGTPHGLTINSFTSLSLDPPLVMVAIDRSSSILDVFESSEHFAVNILRQDQRELSVHFSELPEGRFAGVAWSAGVTGVPVIAYVLGLLECRTVRIFDAGDHRGLIGEVVAANAYEGSPLVFFRSGYTSIG